MGKIRIWDCISDRARALDCAIRELKNGSQIGIPTETVYGLAGNVECVNALEGIFFLKRRPLTDPLILHMASKLWSKRYCVLDSYQERVFFTLADHFWPGPLTLVVEASPAVPEIIRAGEKTVGLRVPAAPFFRETLEALGCGVAAPSANRFGHISPTRAEHVATEFSDADLHIFDEGPCQIGLESSVVRIFQDGSLKILRPGLVTAEDLVQALGRAGLQAQISETLTSKQASPGQDIRHYAPDVAAYRLVFETGGSAAVLGADAHAAQPIVWSADGVSIDLHSAVLVDWGSCLRGFAGSFLQYFDPSPNGDVGLFAQCLFETLRRAEAVPGVMSVLIHFPEVSDHRLASALLDRLNRSTSGRSAHCSFVNI
jgi:L-threonylcarbamoyladenylate synthase